MIYSRFQALASLYDPLAFLSSFPFVWPQNTSRRASWFLKFGFGMSCLYRKNLPTTTLSVNRLQVRLANKQGLVSRHPGFGRRTPTVISQRSYFWNLWTKVSMSVHRTTVRSTDSWPNCNRQLTEVPWYNSFLNSRTEPDSDRAQFGWPYLVRLTDIEPTVDRTSLIQ